MVDTRILNASGRRALERNVLRSFLEDPRYRQRRVFEQLSGEDLESEDLRQVYTQVRASFLTQQSFDNSRFTDTIAEVVSEGVELNGSWSLAAERLKRHSFDVMTYRTTDLGNAERFVAMYGQRVRFDHTRESWLLWTGSKWQYDETRRIETLVAETVRSIYSEAEKLSESEDRKRLAKWATDSESLNRRWAAEATARGIGGIGIISTDLDADPWLLNVQNGVIDLKSTAFLPHDHRYLCSKLAGGAYREGATAPWFESFVARIFDGNADLIEFVRRAVGYTLTGVTDSQAVFFAYGSGANGKSTFLEIIALLLGEYYRKAPSDLILLKRSDASGATPDLAGLRGVRLVVLQEIEAGRRLHESRLKDLTGGDTITARHLYGEPFQFRASGKLWLYGNHRPVVSGTDHGLWRRLFLIPFTVTIPEGERKPMGELLRNARAELPGILNWALRGLADWRDGGLAPPEIVRAATSSYQHESDSIGLFVEECCSQSGEISNGELFAAYRDWAGRSDISVRAFTDRLKDRGYTIRIGPSKRRIWNGISLAGT